MGYSSFCLFLSLVFASFSYADPSPVCPRIPENGSAKMGAVLPYFDDPVAGDYLLIRKPTVNGVDQYDVVINYQINADDANVNQEVQDCFNYFNPTLFGPNGEKMNIRLPQASDPMLPKAAPVTISAGCTAENSGRGSALCWNPAYACSTVVHETLHHLGLVDEYAQTKCRSLGPENSIMSNPSQAAKEVMPKYKFHRYLCNAFGGANLEACQHSLALIESGVKYTKKSDYYGIHFENGEDGMMNDESYVMTVDQEPALKTGKIFPDISLAASSDGFNIKDRTYQTYEALFAQYKVPTRVNPTQLNFIEKIPSARKSLLYPMEASSVLYGRCEANTTFLACEHKAYDSMFCGGKPAICGGGQQTDAWLQILSGLNP